MTRGGALAAFAALVLAAVAPRVVPASAAYHASNDAAEHLLIARALARGEGFTLPIRVRDVEGGPAVHAAFEERAPLFPLLLAVPVRAGVGATGWPDPRLQLVNVALAALCAPLAASIAWALARRRGAREASAAVVAAGAGLVVAWAPSFVRASIHLWAEPLGVLLVLAAARLDLALDGAADGRPRRALLLAFVGGAARFARPEAWVLAPLLVARAAWRARGAPCPGRRGELVALVLGLVVVNVAGILATGVLAPQLFLLEVVRFEDAMGAGAAPDAPDAALISSAVARNVVGQLAHLLLPKEAWLVLPLALLAVARGQPSAERWLVAWAAAFVLATAGVWSTSDPQRFGVAPLALLAPVALVQAEGWRRRRWPGSRRLQAIHATLLVLVLGHAAGEELRDARARPAAPPPNLEPREGVAAVADPWTYALLTARPATLARPHARARAE